MTEALDQLDAAVSVLVGQDPHQLPDTVLLTDTERLLNALDRINAAITRRLQVIDARDATTVEYGRKTRAWLIEDLCRGPQEATKLTTVAKALPARQSIAAALAAGDITLEHARNIAISTKEVPADIQDVFEKELVKAAGYRPASNAASTSAPTTTTSSTTAPGNSTKTTAAKSESGATDPYDVDELAWISNRSGAS